MYCIINWSLACEEAERIIFTDRKPFSMDIEDIDEEEVIDTEYDNVLANYLFKVRDLLFKMIDNESISSMFVEILINMLSI